MTARSETIQQYKLRLLINRLLSHSTADYNEKSDIRQLTGIEMNDYLCDNRSFQFSHILKYCLYSSACLVRSRLLR